MPDELGTLHVVVGGQFGSEGKGAVVGHLTRTAQAPVMVVRVGGPNAGHTVYDDAGQRWPLRQIPAGVVRPDCMLAIAAGSEIDPEVLAKEVGTLEAGGHFVRDRLLIDPQATIVEPHHHARSQYVETQRNTGGTGKGVSAARSDRIMRMATIVDGSGPAGVLPGDKWPGSVQSVAPTAYQILREGGTVIVEGTQGYGLGLHAGFYPFCTSGDCTAIDALAQAQIVPWALPGVRFQTWVVFRTYPIRVAGNSGPLREETSWPYLAGLSGGYIQPEYTTVTQKMRRVGVWDADLAHAAVEANGGHVLAALMMYDYWFPDVAEATELLDNRMWRLGHLEQRIGALIALVGTGPRTIVDRRSS